VGHTVPLRTPNKPYLDLWQFVRTMASEQCAEFDRYVRACHIRRATGGSLDLAELEKAHMEVQIDDPTIRQRPEEFLRTVNHRLMTNWLQWRLEIEQLLRQDLPRMVKEALLSGQYEITARRLTDQAVITLVARDLAALTIDIEKKLMIGSAAVYGEIAIQCLEEPEGNTPVSAAAESLGSTAETGDDVEPSSPRDTMALRSRAKKWLAAHVGARAQGDRDSTLKAMRAAHPGLGVRGSLAVWGEFVKENPQLELSRRGAKLKRNTNN